MTTPNLVGGAVAGGLQSLTQKLLASLQMPLASDNTAYTVPANSAVKIATATICNSTSSAVTLSLSVVPTGGTLDGTHKVISSYLLAANDTLSLAGYLDGMMLGPGDYISINSSAVNALDFVLTGVVSA